MKLKKNLLIFSGITIIALLLVVGCMAPAPIETSISIADGAATTNDSTPSLTISAVGATYMAFSGNGTTWSDWVTYATSYSLFNITTGAGCTTGEGAKTVYAKFKKATGTTFGECNDGIIYDITGPKLLTAVCSDDKNKSSGTINTGDIITFTFDEDMKTSTITSTNFTTQLPLSSTGAKYGTGATFAWSSSDKVCRITLGTSPNIPSGTTVNPSSTVTDAAGNADNSTAITISFTASALASVTITPASKTYIEGETSPQTFTALAKNTAGTDITSLCSITWSESGLGSISPTTGSSTVYTPAASGTGTNTITVSATYFGVTKTKTALVTINADNTSPDPAKLSINGSAGTGKFKATYTDVPTGATIEVYSCANDDKDAAAAAGAISTIELSTPPAVCNDITPGHFIFFKIFYSGGSTSVITADGRMPFAPDSGTDKALDAIQAISKNTVTSTAAGTVETGDKITLYIDTTPYSDPTTVGVTMSTLELKANDLPLYTRTNANGHESVPSVADGKILSPTVTTTNVGAASTLNEGDKITLTFSPEVTVTADILLPHISWVTSGSSKFGGDDTIPLLAGPVASAVTVTLTAFTGCVDFDTDEVVTFNIAANIPIVDTAGNNQVLPLATAEEFDSSDF